MDKGEGGGGGSHRGPRRRSCGRPVPPPKRRRRPQVRYVRPLQAWLCLVLGLFGWCALGPTYHALPPALQARPFRVALWRYTACGAAFALYLGGRGLPPGHRASLACPGTWLRLGAMAWSTLLGFACFGLAVAECRQYALAAGTAALNPFLLLVWEVGRGRPIGKWNRLGLGCAGAATAGLLWADAGRSLPGAAQGLLASAFLTVYVALADVLRCAPPSKGLWPDTP